MDNSREQARMMKKNKSAKKSVKYTSIADGYKHGSEPSSNIMEQPTMSQHLRPIMDDGIRAILMHSIMICRYIYHEFNAAAINSLPRFVGFRELIDGIFCILQKLHNMEMMARLINTVETVADISLIWSLN
ncbi:unnamed protein product [Onchocerca flexuosa]|uniref:Ty3-gypsy retrotransposon protein n=1 Tax=Onchocerca flexuosa TaxID=387005 RepID=A0A183I5E7_9BILA|nr:unnamed protein product [Onchocerca flexuosa]